jgi:broad specificity phosphatase PhoE
MKYIFIILFLFYQPPAKAQAVTTFILIRHAEKVNDGTPDPELTEEGLIRANSLVTLLKEIQVDAIYSTAFKRTTNTVIPLSQAKNIRIQNYEAFKGEEIDQMLKDYTGGTIAVVGHSNNIPWIANYLIGKETYKTFDDSDYDNVLIVTIIKKRKIAKVVWLTY